MTRTLIKTALASEQPFTELLIKGWVRTRRDSKNFSFLEVNDGSCLANLQVIAQDDLTDYPVIQQASTGAAVAIKGELVESPGKGQRWELHARSIELLGSSSEDYPLQKKRHSDEFLRTIAHLRPRTNKYGAMFRLRSRLALAIHDFFRSREFHYLHTPIITGSDCEGAGEMFQVTTLDLAKPPLVKGEPDFSQDFFGKQASLTVSGQLCGETFAMGLGNIYTFGPTFRSENSNTSRHMAEFWMVEPEMAFADLDENMQLGEELIRYLVKFVLNDCAEDLALFTNFVDKGLLARLENIADKAFLRLTYTEAVEILTASGQSFEFPVVWGSDLQSEHERFLTEQHFKQPVILYDYPTDIKAFYMRQNDDGKTVAAMDVLVPGIGEIIGGSQREERLDRLTQRMADMNLDEADYWWYLDTRRYGGAPHAGFGLGFERLLMLLTGVTNIRDVMPFPRTPKNLEF
ncbi:MAG: asparagine--tRNA ligase [Immundisolibacteraceae bacterium]|nr:asparagine--tRNA ligase [Immundisolibacteraceae bacterium]